MRPIRCFPMKTTAQLLIEATYLLQLVDRAEGEITPKVEAGIHKWLSESDDKLGAIRAVLLRADKEAELLREEVARLELRRKGCERLAERMNEKALELLEARERLGEEPRVKTPQYTVWLAH